MGARYKFKDLEKNEVGLVGYEGFYLIVEVENIKKLGEYTLGKKIKVEDTKENQVLTLTIDQITTITKTPDNKYIVIFKLDVLH